FWLKYGPDTEFGGFHGGLDRQGTPDPKAKKSLVQQSRVIWTFASAYHDLHDEAYKKAAKDEYEFFVKHFWDEKNGGWVWRVNRDGSVDDAHKYLYGESFTIYALSAYGRVFHDHQAIELALKTFRVMDAQAHDKAY